jgi:hypothetical protein
MQKACVKGREAHLERPVLTMNSLHPQPTSSRRDLYIHSPLRQPSMQTITALRGLHACSDKLVCALELRSKAIPNLDAQPPVRDEHAFHRRLNFEERVIKGGAKIVPRHRADHLLVSVNVCFGSLHNECARGVDMCYIYKDNVPAC